jgi:pimeloyl-ACP methyl ester carboxylesterase
MYGLAFKKLSDVNYIDWPRYTDEDTIPQLARRIIEQHGIGEHDAVGGSSLGGIVASEIAAQIDIGKLILIGSTLMPETINPVLRQLSALSDITPLDLIRALAGKVGSLHENRLLKMFGSADTRFVRVMCKSVFMWPGNPEPTCEVAHIHGAKDHVIYPPSIGAKLLPDGGHMIAMTHEAEVADFIKLNVAC